MEEATPNILADPAIQSMLEEPPLIFRKFEPEDMRDILNCGEMEKYSEGDIILNEDDEKVDFAYLVVEGQVSIWKDNIHLANLKAGDFIGESFLFSKGIRTATVKAYEGAKLLKFRRQRILEFFRAKPERLFKMFTMNIIEVQQRKITSMNQKMIQMQKKMLSINP